MNARTLRYALALLFALVCVDASPAQPDARIVLHLEEGKSGTVWDVALSNDGRHLFTCGRDSTAKIWSLRTGECLHTLRAEQPTLNTTLALSGDGKYLAVGDMNGTITIWDPGTQKRLASFRAHAKYLLSLKFTPNSRMLVSAGRDDTVKIWNVPGWAPVTSFDAASLWVNDLDVSPDGSALATAGQDGSVKLWKLPNGTFSATLGYHARFVRSIVYSSDGTHLFSGGREGDICIWEIPHRSREGVMHLDGGFAHHIALSHGGNVLAVSVMTGELELWDWRRQLRIRKLGWDSYGAMAACVDAVRDRLYSAHTDGSTKVWNLKDSQLLCRFVGFSDGQWLSFTPDGYYDCSEAGDRYVQWQQGDELYPLRRFSSLYHMPSFLEDALAGSYTPATPLEHVIEPPTVVVLAPRDGQLFAYGSEAPEVVCEVLARDKRKIESIAVSVNGRQIPEANLPAQTVRRTDTTLLQRYRIPVLPGTNTMEVVAKNAARVRSAAARVAVKVETESKLRPNLFVLAVGIDRFAGGYPELRYAVHDAEEIARVLAKQEGGMYTRVYTATLTDRSATKARILQALSSLPALTSQDVLVLFFGGHGIRTRDARGHTRYAFVTADATPSSVARLGLGWDELASHVSRLKAGRVILLLDACHSGDVSAGASNDRIATSLAGEIGIVFASSSGSEYSFENPDLGHGMFVRAFLDGCAGAADVSHDGIVDWSELQLYVTRRVKELSGGSQHPVIPLLENFSDFPFVRIP